jgi:hypothetical protein
LIKKIFSDTNNSLGERWKQRMDSDPGSRKKNINKTAAGRIDHSNNSWQRRGVIVYAF